MYLLPMVVRSWRGLKAGLKLMGRMMAARLRGSRWVTGGAALQGRMLEAALASGVDIREIGRASCRERVCQYVSISGVDVSLKKTKDETNTMTTSNTKEH